MTRRLLRSVAYRLRTRPGLGRAALRLIPDVRWRVRVDGIGPLAIRLRRNRSLWLRDPLESEHFPFTMLRAMVRPGEVVYDAGANLGLYCRFLVAGLGAAKVVAFEPMADNLRLLARNLTLGGIAERVRVLPIALADVDGEFDFQVDDWQSASGTLDRVTGGQPSVGRRNLGLPPLTERVACRSLDALLAVERLPAPDVIKIDVEGAEALLLRGARRVLRERGPRLLIELHGAEWAREVLGLLGGLGYHCRGKVEPHLHPSGYGPLDRSHLPRIEGLYDVHFLVAAKDAAHLPLAYDPSSSIAGPKPRAQAMPSPGLPPRPGPPGANPGGPPSGGEGGEDSERERAAAPGERLTLGVVVTNFNTWGLTRRCLEHLLPIAHALDSILVIDDASTEPPPSQVTELFGEPLASRLRLVRNPENLGLVRSLNRALAEIGTDLVVIFDSDAYPVDDFSAQVRRAFDADPTLALAGFRTVDEEGRPTGSCEPEPGVAELVVGPRLSSWLGRLGRPLRRAGRRGRLCLYACALAIRRRAFVELGCFDEGFDWLDFDHDLSMRVNRSAWRLTVLPEAVAVHRGSGAPQATSARVLRVYMNRWRLLRKHGKIRRPRLVRAAIAARLRLELLVLRTLGRALYPRPEVLADKLAGRRAALKHCRREYR